MGKCIPNDRKFFEGMSEAYDMSHIRILASETIIDYESYICGIDILNMVIERFLNFERTSPKYHFDIEKSFNNHI